jgi:DNA-binding transcriptional MerR regulator
MNTKDLISIGELAELSRVSRNVLLNYDKIKLLKPVYVGENSYRYYSIEQVSYVNFIRTMQHLEIPLKDIAAIAKERTPESMIKFFTEHMNKKFSEVEECVNSHKLMLELQKEIEESLGVSEEKIEFIEERGMKIIIGPENNYSGGRTDWEALRDFYEYCEKNCGSANLYYPTWGMFSEERLKRGDWKYPDRYFLNCPQGCDEKPAGWYVVGYARGHYGETDELYQKMIAYINENGLEICGPAYETYPLNEISLVNPKNYLIRISVKAKRKQ